MTRYSKPITDLKLKAWLAAGAVDRGVGEGLTFVASAPAARAGKASWILRFRLNSRSREKVLGRYPELSLKDAREHARQDRLRIERGIDVAAAKQAEKALVLEVPTVQRLGEVWFARYIQPRYKHPDVVARVLRKHINPVLGPVAPPDVQPVHIDRVLTRIVQSGAPTVANDALRYMSRMFRMAVRNHWIERNPAADFDLLDAGGDETPRDRWLTLDELQQLARAMHTTPNFGRENELVVWLLAGLVRAQDGTAFCALGRIRSGGGHLDARQGKHEDAIRHPHPAFRACDRVAEGGQGLLVRQAVCVSCPSPRPPPPGRSSNEPVRTRRARHIERRPQALAGSAHGALHRARHEADGANASGQPWCRSLRR